MAHPVTWFQISGPTEGPLTDFYTQVFAWKTNRSPDGSMTMVQADKPDGIPGGIVASQNGQPNVTVYINTDDIGATLTAIESAGGQTAMPPMELPGGMGHIAGFIDPGGNWVGLWAPGKNAQPKRAPAKKSKKASPKMAAKKAAKKAAPKKAVKKAAPKKANKKKKK